MRWGASPPWDCALASRVLLGSKADLATSGSMQKGGGRGSPSGTRLHPLVAEPWSPEPRQVMSFSASVTLITQSLGQVRKGTLPSGLTAAPRPRAPTPVPSPQLPTPTDPRWGRELTPARGAACPLAPDDCRSPLPGLGPGPGSSLGRDSACLLSYGS